MKLIVTGATGFVGTEVLRQALRNPEFTEVIALARKHVDPPQDSGDDTGKLRSVVLEDWTAPYPESVKEVIRDADACIWTLAVTPSASRNMGVEEVSRVCHEFTIQGLRHMAECARRPFRFVYTSGVTIERDQSKELAFLMEYRRMRGRTETQILDFAKENAGVEVTITKPAAIGGPGREGVNEAMRPVFAAFGDAPEVHVEVLASVMLGVCEKGCERDTLWPRELVGGVGGL
ncbi:hypothetical protein HYFRA_00010054 [Hymenoscyphus fraxineus]|uniref:NAD-dependent epimerase/dehydratase domain-containing protein n=1 Tax=Hymenoscyphus fraxineus TaxID=746836 RepID=A0A9N9KWV8_9HELO|nr:hypothetical protein HYFRA_00010054 [Hymenoscyphus fraxineus]